MSSWIWRYTNLVHLFIYSLLYTMALHPNTKYVLLGDYWADLLPVKTATQG